MKNILVVEDSKVINNIVSKELKKFDFKVSQAFTFEDAKTFLNSNDYQLIVLDLHLPDGEGSQLINNIQSLTETKVVVLTSSQDEELRKELFEHGILDYIIKDKNLIYSITEIIKIINTLNAKKTNNVLLIDDSKFIGSAVKTILEPRNYKIVHSLTAEDGLEKLKESKFHLLILDMELPDMHGLKVLEIVRKNPKFLYLPILILSGTSTPEIVRNSLKNGASDFLKKPFISEELILKVDLWIDYFSKERELKKKTKELVFVNKDLEKFIAKEIEKNKEQQLFMLQQNRLAQMGELISMIAHQWRQPLNNLSIINQIMIAKFQTGKLDDDSVNYFKKNSKKQIDLMSNTIDDFTDFFKNKDEKEEFALNKVIFDAIDITRPIFNNNKITITFDIKEQYLVFGYQNALLQVVLNILNNAKDALIEKEVEDKKIKISIVEDEEDIVLEIEDNAGGIDEKIIDKIFDPYFSTKQSKNGTGLGLYMSKMIIDEQMQWKLKVCNIDNGVKFKIIVNK